MKLLAIVVTLLATVQARSQARQCYQVAFSGEATQSQSFRQQLGDDLTFSVIPMRLRGGDPRWAWFKIRVLPNDGAFGFNASDENWLLAVSDGWSVLIGAVNSDLNAALEYRSRNLVFPLRGEKQKALEAVALIRSARTAEELRRALATLNALRLAQVSFELTDYGLNAGDPPMGIDWVKFKVRLTLPDDFPFWGGTAPMFVKCPTLPDEVIENVINPNRHKYPVRPPNDVIRQW